MNFEESNEFVEEMERKTKNKKTIMTVIIGCIVAIVVLIGLIFYIKYQDSKKQKMYINNKEVKITSNLLLTQEGKTYINIKQLANMLGYSYQKGEYKKYNEDEKSCYLRSNYEIASMSADSTVVTKYILNNKSDSEEDEEDEEKKDEEDQNQTQNNVTVHSENETQETFYITDTIIYKNNELYIPFSEVQRIFNVQLNLSQTNRIKIYSLEFLIANAQEYAKQLGYPRASDVYENMTALIDNMLVVIDDSNNYGVVSLADTSEIISLKYEDIVYMQNTKEFLVTAEGSVGIVSSTGETIIKPTEYDNIANLDELSKLYLVAKNNKYGVVDGEGNIVVHPEFDAIGLENKDYFMNENIHNFSLIYDDCIPVYSNGKVGIVTKDGEEGIKCVYDSLGFVANESEESTSTKKKNEEDSSEDVETEEEQSNTTKTKNTTKVKSIDGATNVLTIPESLGIKGIVVKKGLYGIYDVTTKRLIVPCAYSKIYSKTKSGVTKYYLEYNGQQMELESYLEENNLKNIDTNNSQDEVEEQN